MPVQSVRASALWNQLLVSLDYFYPPLSSRPGQRGLLLPFIGRIMGRKPPIGGVSNPELHERQHHTGWCKRTQRFDTWDSVTWLHMSARLSSICKELSKVFLCSPSTSCGTLQASVLDLKTCKPSAAFYHRSNKRSHDALPRFPMAVRKRWYKHKSLDVSCPQEKFAQTSVLKIFRFLKNHSILCL